MTHISVEHSEQKVVLKVKGLWVEGKLGNWGCTGTKRGTPAELAGPVNSQRALEPNCLPSMALRRATSLIASPASKIDLDSSDEVIFSIDGTHLALSDARLTSLPSFLAKRHRGRPILEFVTSIDCSVNKMRYAYLPLATAHGRKSHYEFWRSPSPSFPLSGPPLKPIRPSAPLNCYLSHSY